VLFFHTSFTCCLIARRLFTHHRPRLPCMFFSLLTRHTLLPHHKPDLLHAFGRGARPYARILDDFLTPTLVSLLRRLFACAERYFSFYTSHASITYLSTTVCSSRRAFLHRHSRRRTSIADTHFTLTHTFSNNHCETFSFCTSHASITFLFTTVCSSRRVLLHRHSRRRPSIADTHFTLTHTFSNTRFPPMTVGRVRRT
jgi:hypothetical protein